MRVSHDTDVQLILKLMLERWNLEIPNLVISVTGGAKSFVLKPRLKEVFRRGLIKAAKSTSAWIITGLCLFQYILTVCNVQTSHRLSKTERITNANQSKGKCHEESMRTQSSLHGGKSSVV